jgi:hypothetical protein
MAHTKEARAALIQRYADGPAVLRAALDRVPAAAMKWRPGPDKWSPHEVVVHCADSESNATMRIRYLVAENNPRILGYDQDVWARLFDYHSHPLDLALATIVAVRGNTLPLLRRLPDEAWSRGGTHSESGPYSADDWLQSYGEHLETHARQIDRIVAAWHAKAGS